VLARIAHDDHAVLLEPPDEMVRIVGDETHPPGADIEAVAWRLRRIGKPARRLARRPQEEDPRPRTHMPCELDGERASRQPRADDSDVKGVGHASALPPAAGIEYPPRQRRSLSSRTLSAADVAGDVACAAVSPTALL
jgi:hypothetical protein